ncbi:flagellar filament capping protein FliD [Uliginosibacterium sp. H3]|uniref:Flagellar hook-associated protein 2 n=1 Tax=Uliginosibacterium silvisoli TaxID=3114758 RepID=A0ABU6K956_9RHOO|nr:flagellar filament capping protein FliD [Uliginosibacterium sp. H3]
MATGSITSAGLGSGIDVEALVTKLVALERAPIEQLQAKETSVKTQLSAYGTLKSTLSALQDAAEALQTKDKFASNTANVADSAIAAATVDSTATAGSYSLEVAKLAQTEKIRSTGYASATSTIPTGTLKIDLGTFDGASFTADSARSFNVTIDSSNNTLSGLRDAINNANAGVTASLVNDGTSTRLVVSSKDTGASNAFQLSGLTGFDFNPAASGSSSMLSTQVAQDAAFTLDGIAMTRSSNTVTDALTGVSLTLKAKTTAATTVNVGSDTTSITSKVNAFVTAYNNAVGLMSSQTSYNATSKTAGPLNGESSVRSIQSQLRSIMGGTVGSTVGMSRLADVGIQIGTDGKLTVNSDKLSTALKDPTKDVASLFTTSTTNPGFASQIATRVKSILGTDGILTTRTDGLNKNIKSTDDNIAKMELRITAIEARYRAQFNAMDSTIAGLTTTGNFLTTQLAKLL